MTGAVPALIAAICLWGCASTGTPTPTDQVTEAARYAVTCEAALIELERLIALRSQDDGFPRADLIEAQELQRQGRELYLERDYVLALELIEEGIQLVEEQHH